jgi:hypothetical protein
MKLAILICTLFLGFVGSPFCQAQTPSCDVLTDEAGRQKANGSRLCIEFKFTEGKLDFDRTQSVFRASEEFKRRLSISAAQAEESLFIQLRKLFNSLEKPYRLGLSDEERALDDQHKLDPSNQQHDNQDNHTSRQCRH